MWSLDGLYQSASVTAIGQVVGVQAYIISTVTGGKQVLFATAEEEVRQMRAVMQTFKQGFDQPNLMTVEDLALSWRSRLSTDCPEQSGATRESIIRWLLGFDLERFGMLNPYQLEIAKLAMEFRYRILRHRYLGLEPERAYRNLMTRLGSLVLLRNKIRTWVAKSRDRQRAVVDVLQEVIQELLTSDRYMQQQMAWIAECTGDARLRNALLLASTEEYCLRPIPNQPLLVYRFVNYISRTSRGGLTQVPDEKLRQSGQANINTTIYESQ